MPYSRQLFALLAAVPCARADLTNVDGEDGLPYANKKPQNQQQCGSCWAFSTTEMLSARILLKQPGGGGLEEAGSVLSAQAPVAFGHSYFLLPYLSGCNGGNVHMAAKYLMAKGIPASDCAPYTSGSCGEGVDDLLNDGCTSGSSYTEGTCWGWSTFKPPQWNTFGKATTADRWLRGYEVKRIDGYEAMQADIAAHGPLSAYFDFFKEFGDYTGGVLTRNTPDKGGHAILITGYAVNDDGTPYWRIRNSWGSWWGENGYVRFLRGSNFANLEIDAISVVLGSDASGSNESASRLSPYHPPIQKYKPGAWVDRDVTDDVVLEAKDALQKHLNTSSIYVMSAHSQVVQGVKVHLIVGTRSGNISAVAHKQPMYSGTTGKPIHRIVKITSVSDSDALFFV